MNSCSVQIAFCCAHAPTARTHCRALIFHEPPRTGQALHIDQCDHLRYFGIDVHCAVDGASRMLMWIRVLRSNRCPRETLKCYLDMLAETGCDFRFCRMDRGTENGLIGKVHAHLRRWETDFPSFPATVFGSSVSNTKVEARWRGVYCLVGCSFTC